MKDKFSVHLLLPRSSVKANNVMKGDTYIVNRTTRYLFFLFVFIIMFANNLSNHLEANSERVGTISFKIVLHNRHDTLYTSQSKYPEQAIETNRTRISLENVYRPQLCEENRAWLYS